MKAIALFSILLVQDSATSQSKEIEVLIGVNGECRVGDQILVSGETPTDLDKLTDFFESQNPSAGKEQGERSETSVRLVLSVLPKTPVEHAQKVLMVATSRGITKWLLRLSNKDLQVELEAPHNVGLRARQLPGAGAPELAEIRVYVCSGDLDEHKKDRSAHWKSRKGSDVFFVSVENMEIGRLSANLLPTDENNASKIRETARKVSELAEMTKDASIRGVILDTDEDVTFHHVLALLCAMKVEAKEPIEIAASPKYWKYKGGPK